MLFWVTLIRGIFAITLGAVLLLQPEQTRSVLANYMGMYWLMSGLVSVRWSVSSRRRPGLALLAGIVGIVAGLGMLSRNAFSQWASLDLVLSLLGLIILLTGLMHIFGGFREVRERRVSSTLLGLFEAVLGLVLIWARLERGPLLYIVAATWALLGGIILVGDALYLRRQARLSKEKHDGIDHELL